MESFTRRGAMSEDMESRDLTTDNAGVVITQGFYPDRRSVGLQRFQWLLACSRPPRWVSRQRLCPHWPIPI